ncbi:MAG: hypothetical protein Q8Q35_01115 [Nanoarchaeota archaeon]|nr:hypothetical protein [Nanoarchaeota archaeon]
MRVVDFKRVVGYTHERWISEKLGLLKGRGYSGLDLLSPDLSFGVEVKSRWDKYALALEISNYQVNKGLSFLRDGIDLYLGLVFYGLNKGSKGGHFNISKFQNREFNTTYLEKYCNKLEQEIVNRNIYFISGWVEYPGALLRYVV